jgi:hypothetical protein
VSSSIARNKLTTIAVFGDPGDAFLLADYLSEAQCSIANRGTASPEEAGPMESAGIEALACCTERLR